MPTPSEQLLTRTVYATDGVTTNWDFSFSGGYLDKSHVKAFTEATTGERTEIIVTEAMIVGPFQVRIAPALAAGLTLTVYRDTPKDLPLVDFTDESGFSEIALDTNAKQAVFIAAETTDTVNTASSYDAEQAASQAAIAAGEAQASATAAAASALLAANEADASAASAVLSAANATIFNDSTTAYTRTLLDDTNAAAARATLGAAASGANTDITSLANIASINSGQLAGMRNRIINGDMRVSQRRQVNLINNVPIYGGCDRTFVAPSLFTTATGTVQQEPVSITATGSKASQWVAITTTGTGNLVFAQRIESANCFDLSGEQITVSARIAQNTGASVNCQILITAANAVDNFSAETVLATGPLVSVPTGLTGGTYITFSTTLAAFAAANGLCVNVRFTGVGAVTSKSFYVSNLQLEVGSVATPFEHRPYGIELALCQRYYYRVTATSAEDTLSSYLYVTSATTAEAYFSFPVTMRDSPSLLEHTGTATNYNIRVGATSTVCSSAPQLNTKTTKATGVVTAVCSSGLTSAQAGTLTPYVSTAAFIGWSSEL